MEMSVSTKKEIISLILDKQIEMIEEEVDMDYVMYLDEIKNTLWDSLEDKIEIDTVKIHLTPEQAADYRTIFEDC